MSAVANVVVVEPLELNPNHIPDPKPCAGGHRPCRGRFKHSDSSISYQSLIADISGGFLGGNVLRRYPAVSVPPRGILEHVDIMFSVHLMWMHVKPQLEQRI